MEYIEDGKRPKDIYAANVQCPYCGAYNDYWKTALSLGLGEKINIGCLNPFCKKYYYVKKISGGLEAVQG